MGRLSSLGNSISGAWNQLDDTVDDAWLDWGRDAAIYTGLIAGAALTGGAVGGATLGLYGGVAAATYAYKDQAGKAADRAEKKIMGSLSRAQARARELEPKGIDPQQAVARRRQRMAGALGRSDTILTGPLGLIGGSGAGGRVIGA